MFIFEVKNYKGQLYGNEDDYNWEKYKDDGYGNTFVKEVKNPVKQVKGRFISLRNIWKAIMCGLKDMLF